jgi:Zn-finger nucleic acid-binding protein
MSPPAALHCSGCGRELGPQPLAEPSELRCPDCALELQALRGRSGTLFDCGRCGGQLVEHALLRDLLERSESYASLGPRDRAAPPPPVEQRVRYRPCPACAPVLMNRRSFGQASGIVVDVCARHGTWFDAGELPRVLAAVERGRLRIGEPPAQSQAASGPGSARPVVPLHELPPLVEEPAGDPLQRTAILLYEAARDFVKAGVEQARSDWAKRRG